MTTLKLQNTYSWLTSDNEDLKDLLFKSLRFRPKNYFMNPLYKQHKWDGWSPHFAKESGRFLTGLLPEIQLALEYKQEKHKIIDERNRFPFAIKKVDDQFLNQWLEPGREPVTLRDYQVDYINKIILHGRGILQAPTRAGKSLALVGALKCLPPKTPTLIMTKSTDLCHQLYDDIKEWNVEGLGKCIGGKKKDFCPNLITIANVDSAHKIEKLLPHFKALFVDEVHLMLSKVPKIIYRRMPNASVRIGISATPFKDDGNDLCQKYDAKGFFGPLLKTDGKILTTKELQNRGILSKSKCIFYPIDEPSLPYETFQDAVTFTMEGIQFNKIVARLSKTLEGRTLIIVERIEQGQMLNALIPGSHWICGENNRDDRKEVIELLKNSEQCICIVQQGLISAGITVLIHNLISVLGGKSTHTLIQRFGRGLGTAEDKECMTYYDFLFNNNSYLYKHSKKRIEVLKKEGHDVEIKEEIDF